MNRLRHGKQVQVIAALCEGASVRSVERLYGTHRDTVIRTMLRVGDACARKMNEDMRDLPLGHVQVDEIWGYVLKKQRHVREDDDPERVGDYWTYVSLDTTSKLVPSYFVGKRTAENTRTFVSDLASRVRGRIQLSSDMLAQYVDAVDRAFGSNVDYGRVVKYYEAEPFGAGRYSPPRVSGIERDVLMGRFDPLTICTSHVERQNWSMRGSMRRLTRLSNGFSRKPENLKGAIAVYFGWYNYVRIHRTLNTTPAVCAGVADREWSVSDLVALAN